MNKIKTTRFSYLTVIFALISSIGRNFSKVWMLLFFLFSTQLMAGSCPDLKFIGPAGDGFLVKSIKVGRIFAHCETDGSVLGRFMETYPGDFNINWKARADG